MSQPGTSKLNETTGPENRLFLGALVLALVAGLGIFGIELAGGLPAWPGLLRAAVALVTLGFTAGEAFFSGRKQFPASWEIAALLLTVLILLIALFTGPEFNIMLAPLLVGLAQRRQASTIVIKLGLAGLVLGGLELLGYFWLGFRPGSDSGGINLVALAALTFSLANYLKRYYRQLNTLQNEAASKASEMEVAHEIQTSLMPPNNFTSGNWTLSARSVPARNVGGDFYEYVYHPSLEKTISGIAIGDVAGKGIPAALQMAVVRTLFRVEARRRIFPSETLYSVNMALQAERSFGMVTMCYAMLDLNSNMLHLANAGHNYPLLLTENTLEEIGLPGLPLGIDDSIEYEEDKVKIEPGSSVIFYTDGVPEAMDRDGNLFTFERFKEAVQLHRELDAGDMVAALLGEIASFTQGAAQSDDITILVLQYHPQTGKINKSNQLANSPGQQYNYI
jgi:serine phosphatase RsbU (regulator of sigma subunit)